MADLKDQHTAIPVWDENADTFDDYCKSCYWYVDGLRDSDRELATARIIQKFAQQKGDTWNLIKQCNKKTLAGPLGLKYLLTKIKLKLIPSAVPGVEKHAVLYSTYSPAAPVYICVECRDACARPFWHCQDCGATPMCRYCSERHNCEDGVPVNLAVPEGTQDLRESKIHQERRQPPARASDNPDEILSSWPRSTKCQSFHPHHCVSAKTRKPYAMVRLEKSRTA